VIAWGRNVDGQTNVPTGLYAVGIAAGADFSAAIKPDGTVVTWGNNTVGQCSPPRDLSDVVALAAGGQYCLALRADGTVVEWGYAGYTVGARAPAGLNKVVAISTAGDQSLALRYDGAVVSWAFGNYPGWVPGDLGDVVAVAAASDDSLSAWALRSDGTVEYWNNPYYIYKRQQALVFSDGVAISSWTALRSDGRVYRLPSENYLSYPPTQLNLTNVLQVSAGLQHTAAICAEGNGQRIYVDGSGTYGQTNVPGDTWNAIAISAGVYHTVALIGVGQSRAAQATAQLANGFVVGIQLTNSGNNYIEVPDVVIAGGGGRGATAVAQILNGVVTGITVTSAGSGYTSPPEIRIASPWFEPTVTVTTNATQFEITAEFDPAKTYQIEQTADFLVWSPLGPLIASDTGEASIDVPKTNAISILRLREAP
jgi:hypothetical protein